MDDGAKGAGGVAVDGSMGMQRAYGGGGMTDMMLRVHGEQWHVRHDSGDVWGLMVVAHGVQQWGCLWCDSGDMWGVTVRMHGCNSGDTWGATVWMHGAHGRGVWGTTVGTCGVQQWGCIGHKCGT